MNIKPKVVYSILLKYATVNVFLPSSLGGILDNWQGINMASWRIWRNAIQKHLYDSEEWVKRDILFSTQAVGGNAKSGIQFYGKGSPSLDVSTKTNTVYQLHQLQK